MKQKTMWMVPMTAILALSLVSCGEKPAQNTDDTLQNVGQGAGDVMQSVEEGAEKVGTAVERRLASGAGSRDLAGADGVVGSPATTVNPASTAYDSTQGRPTGDTMKRMGEGIKNTLDDMGEKAEDLARDVKNSMK